MNKRLKETINEYYNSFMWMKQSHYKHVLEVAETKGDSPQIDNMTREEIYSAIETIEPQMKEVWFKQLSLMKNMSHYYSFPQKIFPVGKNCEIKVRCRYNFQKLTGKFKVIISPYYNYDFKPFHQLQPDILLVSGNGTEISIPYSFSWEDRYLVSIYEVDENRETLFMKCCFYAVEDDLYELNPYKADLHMHTTFSDGLEDPSLVMTSVREKGMDICAVTDHNNFQGSVEARKAAAEMNLNLTVLLGEEYSLAYSPMHIVSLGMEEPIGRYFLSHKLAEDNRVKELMQNTPDLECDKLAYACTQILLDEVNKQGGVTILAHPFWKPINNDGSRIDTPEKLFAALASDKKFSGMEIVSGSHVGDCDVSSMQNSFAQDILQRYKGIPLTGITDSHSYTCDSICGKHFTVIFSKSTDQNDVLNALKQGMCVAVEIENNRPLCYGEYRFVKFANFLVDFYFPERDEKAKVEGILAREKYLQLE